MKILIVDDQPNMRWGISRIMRLAGFDTLEAESGSECIGIARSVKPDMILLDVVLGDSDGKEVCRTLKSDPETAGIPILLVSGLMTDLDSQADGMECGADGCISKPIHSRELLARVKAILRIRESERSLADALEFTNRILEASPTGIATLNKDCRRILFNRAMQGIIQENFFHGSQDVSDEFQLLERLGLSDLADQALLNGSEQRKQVCLPGDSETEVCLDCCLSRFRSKDEWHLLVTVNDITLQKKDEKEKLKLIERLQDALAQVKRLSGLLPICSSCKKIRDDLGYWKQIEVYIRDHSDADFTHSICPDCARRLYPEYYKE